MPINHIQECGVSQPELRPEAASETSARGDIFEKILDATRDAIILVDNEGIINLLNKAAEQMFGWSQAEAIGKGAHELLAPDDFRNAATKAIDVFRVTETGPVIGSTLELEAIHKNGLRFPVELSLSSIEIEGKNGMVGTFRDITERKKSENIFFELNRLNEQIIANTQGIIVYDRNLLYRTWNPFMECLTGLTAMEVLGKHPLDVFPFLQDTGMIDRLKATLDGKDAGSSDFPYHVPSSGKTGWVSDLSIPMRNEKGEITGVLGTVQDITIRKEAEQELVASKDRYEKLFESSRDSLMTLEPPAWLFTSCNSATCKMFGAKDTAEFASHAPWELSPQYQPDGLLSAEKAKEMIDTAMKEGSHLFEWTHKRLNGEEFPATVLLTRVEIGDKAVVQATVRDITDSKRSEAALREAERMGTIGEVAAGMAHDFNNLLQHILGCIELALMDRNISDDTKEDLLSSKHALMDTAGRLKDLLRFAGKSREAKKYETLNLKSILDDALIQTRALWKDEPQSCGLTIDVLTHCPAGLTFLGDAGEMRSVLFNMIKNSVEAMPEGGVISIVGAKMIEDEICLTIVDTGKGMDENTRKRVFDPFYSTKGFECGRGFGMSNVFTIVRGHKGTIRVASTEPGKGTTFEIRLPFADDKPVSQMPEAGVEKIIPARVLWVDDEKMISKVGKRILLVHGHNVDTAGSGSEAIKLLSENKYDLMITDVGMPGMSGYQLIEKIKGRYPDMKIAVLTGWNDSISDEEKEQRGIGRVFGKPIVASEIRDLVREVMQMKQR